MQDYEKLGVFYLGRVYDPASKQATGDLLLYDSKDLVTHAVCVGMTGSGKTGLCIGLIEEAAIDAIPSIVIDPKGDLANLLLTFPELRPDDFRPFINEDEARTRGITPDDFAAAQAALWRNGLADWDEPPERIAALKNAAEFAVYTPASSAGRPVSILRSFAAPPQSVLDDREGMRTRVAGAATSLLSLVGVDADPVQSREHILLSTLLDRAWRAGQDVSLGDLVAQVQNPPVAKLGVMDLESFYPARERFALAMKFNAVLASPGFEAWLEGDPLDIAAMLHSPAGKPRVSIFSIAHLNDTERMFFVSLLLNQIVSWMRTQPGTTSLRALLYMDEIAGYFPPVANPPSKAPLLTLMKQARAFGLGVVLATQNPVDIDYKGLSNAGTWFVGRLQTERDKARLLDGLEGAAGDAGAKFDRAALEKTLSGLGARVFLLNNVHEDAPELFHTRWTLSYLRGPLSREQLQLAQRYSGTSSAPGAPPAASSPGDSKPARKTASRTAEGVRPVLPPDIPQFFLPSRAAAVGSYSPALYGAAQVRLADRKSGIDETRTVYFTTPIEDAPLPVDWTSAEESDVPPNELESEPKPGAAFANLPAAAAKARSYAGWTRDFKDWLYATQTAMVLRSASGLVSNPGESERDFRIRLQQAGREERDRAAEALRAKYASRIAVLQDRLRRAQQAEERERQQAAQQRLSTALSVGSTLLGAFLGRRTFSATTVNRAAGAVRTYGRVAKESADVDRAGETVAAVQQQLDALNAQFQADVEAAQARLDPASESLQTFVIRPKKAEITVSLVALAWIPQTGS